MKKLIAREGTGRSATRERGGVGLGVGVSLHNACYVKPTPAGSRRVEAEGGVGQGMRLIRNFLSDGDAARNVTGPAREGRDWRGPCISGADSPVFFLRSEAK